MDSSSCLCTKRRKRIRTRQKVTHVRRHLLSEDFTELCLDEEGLTDVDVARLSKSLRTNRHLVELHLCENYISRLGALDLASAVAVHPTLREIWLSINCIGREALVSNKTLVELNISRNAITPRGTRPLGRALMQNRTLVSLGMSGNTILDEGVKTLAPGVGLSSIEELRIGEAGVTAEGAAAIVDELNDHSRRLSVLDVTGNEIDDVEVLEEVMTHNTSGRVVLTTSGRLKSSQHSGIDPESVTDNSDAERCEEQIARSSTSQRVGRRSSTNREEESYLPAGPEEGKNPDAAKKGKDTTSPCVTETVVGNGTKHSADEVRLKTDGED